MQPHEKGILLTVCFLILAAFASAAILEGEVYDGITLQTIKQVHITIGTDPPQLITTQEGRYSIELPPGTYQINAMKVEQGISTRRTREIITITSNERYEHDLILLPPLEMTIQKPLPSEAELAPDIFSNLAQPVLVLLLIGILALGIEAVIMIARKNKAPVSEPPYKIMEINNMLPPLPKEEKRKRKTKQSKLT